MSTLNSIRKYVLACAMALAVVAMAVVGLMMLTITYDVVVRFTFSAPTDWAYPLNAAGVLVATSLAIPYFYAKGQHISMDLVHRALPAGARRAADVVTAAATAFLGLVLAVTAYRSMTVALAGGLTGSGTFSIPLWVPDAVLFLSGVLLAVVAVLFPPGGWDDGAAAVVEGGAATSPPSGADPSGAHPSRKAGTSQVPPAASQSTHADSTDRRAGPGGGNGPAADSGTGEGETRS
ncbi:TRAP transporter small permease [Streptomyces marispadix]|uniref:TRAP transporter small permease n=1 Tax=Streptomyces marispadix TaxID=2922868 RepID=A0ABS9SS67_9ACTN|nr:TRAP transporter small permease [Streptomyces marispadix]MCH6159112.1 TRAP transporter small permease [Streptomyces marispadix]